MSDTLAPNNVTTAQPTPPAVDPLTALVNLNTQGRLALGDGQMDATHDEFVQFLSRLNATPGRDQLPLYREFLAHTEAHFAQEERWMVATGFAADNCHASHHATILDTMRAVESHFLQGDNQIIQRLVEALAEWFPQHAGTMDAGLAQHLRQVGFDSRTETLADPAAIKAVTMSGCGSVSCS